MRILEDFKHLDPADAHLIFGELLNDYLQPAYGSMTKRDFDIALFMKLQELGLIKENPELYDIVRDLRVTRTKARNLLYESKLRKSNNEKLDEELKQLILHPVFLKDDDKIVFEVGNPLLVDHIRSRLKSLGHITDGSFSPELIKLRHEAFSALFIDCLPDQSKEILKKAFIKCGATSDTSIKAVIGSALKKAASKVAGKAGEEALKSMTEYIKPIVEGKLEGIIEKYAPFLKTDEKPASEDN